MIDLKESDKELNKFSDKEEKNLFGDEGVNEANSNLENSVWDFYKSTFNLHKERLIKKKM